MQSSSSAQAKADRYDRRFPPLGATPNASNAPNANMWLRGPSAPSTSTAQEGSSRYEQAFPTLGSVPDEPIDPKAEIYPIVYTPPPPPEEKFNIIKYNGMGKIAIEVALSKHPKKVTRMFDKMEIYRDFVVAPSEVEFLDENVEDDSILTKPGSQEWSEKVKDIVRKGLSHAEHRDVLQQEASVMKDLETDVPLNPFAISRLTASNKLLTSFQESCRNISNMSTPYDPMRRVECRFTKHETEESQKFRDFTKEFNQMKRLTDKSNVLFTSPFVNYFMWRNSNGEAELEFDGAVSCLGLLRRNQVRILNKDPNDVVLSKNFNPETCRILRRVSQWDHKILQMKGNSSEYDGYYIAEFRNRTDAAELVRQRIIQPCPAQLMDGSHNQSEFVEEVGAKLRWRTVGRRKRIDVKLDDVTQTEHAVAALKGNEIDAEESKKKKQCHVNIKCLPRRFLTEQHARAYIRRVLSENGIATRSVIFQRTFSRDGEPTAQCIPHSEKLKKVSDRMVELARDLRVWQREMDDNYRPGSDTDSELWTLRIDRRLTDDRDREDTMSIEFSNVSFGCQMLEIMFEKMPREKFISFGENRAFIPTIEPVFRVLLRCPRNVRFALDEELKAIDHELRSESENKEWARSLNEIGQDIQDCYPFLRLTDGGSDGNDEVIGVEGWPKSNVLVVFRRLRKLMEWRVLDVDDHLFYGYGEAFVYYVEQKLNNKIVVDIDKFNRKLRVVGSNEAVARATDYFANWKTQIIRTNIVVAAPRYFNAMRRFIGRADVFNELKSIVRSLKKEENHLLSFEGSIGQFHGLQDLFDEINETLSKEGCGLVESGHNPKCPVCMDVVGYDFHRLDECGHLYCRPCLNLMLVSHMNELNSHPLKCCAENCDELISPFDYKYLVIGGSQRQEVLDHVKLGKMFRKAKSDFVKNKKQQFSHCMRPDCDGILSKTAHRGNLTKCDTCDTTACANCLREPHDGYTCEEYAHLVDDADFSLQEFVKKHPNEKFRRCPACEAMIQKDGGCNHVLCISCGVQICWVCGFTAERDAYIYDHIGNEHGNFGGGWVIQNDQVILAPDDDIDPGLR